MNKKRYITPAVEVYAISVTALSSTSPSGVLTPEGIENGIIPTDTPWDGAFS